MSFGNSRSIVSNQTDIHEGLDSKVRRHLSQPFLKPIAEHSLQAFQQTDSWIKQHDKAVWLDACCGVGASSIRLAERHPELLILGVDKSLHRLEKQRQEALPDNLLLLRADLNDFWRLAFWAKWPVVQQTILYPNPWPKSEHLGRRWHGAPVFPYIAALGGRLEMRSNWPIYLREFAQALGLLDIDSQVAAFSSGEGLTPFEVKYQASGQKCWQMLTNLKKADIPVDILYPGTFQPYF